MDAVVRGREALGFGDLAQGSATYCNLAKLQPNRAESMRRREGVQRTREVSGGLDTKPSAIIDGNQVGDHIAPLASIF
jgi:hypothetical protein